MFSSRKTEKGSPRERPARSVCCSGDITPCSFHCSNRVSMVIRSGCRVYLSYIALTWREHSCVLGETQHTGQALSPDKVTHLLYLWSGHSCRRLCSFGRQTGALLDYTRPQGP